MEFLAVVGAIALFFFGKFIYDTYITDNTNKNWEKYQRNNSESAARAEKNKGLDFNTKSVTNQNKKIDSYIFLANNLKCSPEHVEAIYTKDLRKNISHSSQALEMAKSWKNEKYEQSKQLNIDPDDTPASLLETWTMSVFNDLKRFENISYKEDEDEDEEEEDEDEDEDEEDEDEEQEEYGIEYETGKITISGLRNIEILKSHSSDVIEAFGKPDEIASNRIIYNTLGLSFYFQRNDKTKKILMIKISENFEEHFPYLNRDYLNRDYYEAITLFTVINAYGEVGMGTDYDFPDMYRTCNTLSYYDYIKFYSEYSEQGEGDSYLLRSVEIGRL
jgi:hypothetical protein